MYNKRSKKLVENEESDTPRVPLEIARQFVHGEIVNKTPVVHEGHKSVMHLCFESKEPIVRLGQTAKLRVDYRQYKEHSSERYDQVRFDYVAMDKEKNEEHSVAAIHLAIVGDTEFVLEHRYVDPEHRRLGLATRLLKQTEDWLGQVAQEANRNVDLSLQTGQKGVIDWAKKNGFEVQVDQKELLKEIVDNPDHFVLEDIIDKDGVHKDMFVFKKDTVGRTIHDAIRLTFHKTIPRAFKTSTQK